MTKRRSFRLITLAVVVAAFLTCALVGTTVAKFMSGYSVSAGASTAKFDISVSGEPEDLSLTREADEASFTFSVTSTSEVAVTYDVILTLPEDLPSGVTLTLTVGNQTIEPTVSGRSYTFRNADVLKFSASGGTNSHVLKVKAEAQAFSADVSMEDIGIRVEATQARPN